MSALGILAVWLTWTLLEQIIEGPKWAWMLVAVALGSGWQLLVDWDRWYLGIGIGGGAALLILVTDLLLVLTDFVRVTVLRRSSTR
jgi:hypothetical protein